MRCPPGPCLPQREPYLCVPVAGCWCDDAQADDEQQLTTLRGWFVSEGFTPPADAPTPRDAMARQPGTLVYVVDLPGSLGRTIELRRRDGDAMVVRSEVYSTAGVLRLTLTRVWTRAPDDDPHVVRISSVAPAAAPMPLPRTVTAGAGAWHRRCGAVTTSLSSRSLPLLTLSLVWLSVSVHGTGCIGGRCSHPLPLPHLPCMQLAVCAHWLCRNCPL
jgi:hypothetical protein